MNWTSLCFAAAGIVTAFTAAASPVSAQGILYYLPESNQQVEYEGTLTQATGPTDEAPLTWRRELIIKSVGSEMAEYDGVVQPCRWIEIKVVTGKPDAGGILPGPVGSRVYKILVPESKIIPDAEDSDTIPNHMIPFVRGFRRLGEEAHEPLKSSALRIYPTISLLTDYDAPRVISNGEPAEIIKQGLTLQAKHLRGESVMERPESRSTNVADYWVTREVPFGLARWTVTVTREEKESTAARDAFRAVSIVKVDMKLREIRDGAESELQTN